MFEEISEDISKQVLMMMNDYNWDNIKKKLKLITEKSSIPNKKRSDVNPVGIQEEESFEQSLSLVKFLKTNQLWEFFWRDS